MQGFQNFLQFLYENWIGILVCAGLICGIGKKTVDFFSKSNEEKIAIAKRQVKETMLRMITDAEISYEEWNKAGSIKRSQVIEEIFTNYPILSKIVSQDELIKWIDSEIDNALVTLREIIKENE